MEAASQLISSGIAPLRRLPTTSDQRRLRRRFPASPAAFRRSAVVSVATEPKPGDSGTSSAAPLPKSSNGAATSLGSKSSNGAANRNGSVTPNGAATVLKSKSSNGVASRNGSVPGTSSRTSSSTSTTTNGAASFQSFGDVSAEIKRVRKKMEEDEQLAILMRGLRGQNLNDSQFADENVKLRLVEVSVAENSEALPIVYDPDIISEYWGKRPKAVATRIVQLLSVAGGFLSHLAWDLITKKVKEDKRHWMYLFRTAYLQIWIKLFYIKIS